MAEPVCGIDVDDLGVGVKDGLKKAAELDFRTVELGTAEGEAAPSRLSASGRRHLSRYAEGLGLSLSALTADFPRLRLTDPQTVEERVDRTREVLRLARELHVPVVTTAVGALTHPESGDPSPPALEALARIGEYADSSGVQLALRPAHDTAERLARVFEELRCPSLRICLDPAAMIMTGVNPFALIARFPERISLFHVRDGTTGMSDRTGRETRLGEGDVDFAGLFELLEEADYRGVHILRRTDTANPIADFTSAKGVLKQYLRLQ